MNILIKTAAGWLLGALADAAIQEVLPKLGMPKHTAKTVGTIAGLVL